MLIHGVWSGIWAVTQECTAQIPFQPLLRGRVDGISAADCSAIMSLRDLFRSGVLSHVYLQSKLERRYGAARTDVRKALHTAGFKKEKLTELPVFIDTGSFEEFQEGQPWGGYRQFSQLFLFPLLLQSYRDLPFQPLLRGRVDGISAADCNAIMSLRVHSPGVTPLCSSLP